MDGCWSFCGHGTLTEDTVITSILLSTYVTGGVGTLAFTSDDLPPGLEILAGATSITGTPTGGSFTLSNFSNNCRHCCNRRRWKYRYLLQWNYSNNICCCC